MEDMRATSLFVLLALFLAACGGGGGESAPAAVTPPPSAAAGLDARPNNATCVAPQRPQASNGFQLTRVFPNLSFDQPVGMFQPVLDSSRWYVIEQQSGLVRSFPNDPGAQPADVRTVLDLGAKIQTAEEMGLLGLAFHPQWPGTPQVFIYYSVASTSPVENRVSRFTSSDGGASLDPASEQVILRFVKNQPDSNHNGGNIAFGPDGYLYIGTGDGGNGGDPNNNAQNLKVLFGKMLRIDVSPANGYAIPTGSAGNPYAANPKCSAATGASGTGGSASCPEIFAYGLRNPWRWSFDKTTKDLWVGDVGQDQREEIDVVQRGGNYGWRIREAGQCYNPGTNCGTTGASGEALIDPLVEYDHSVGQAVTGGYVYRGSKVPGLVGRYVFADYVSSRMFSFQPPNPLKAAAPRVVLMG
jgi:glucose/arabinose dehydrogenase